MKHFPFFLIFSTALGAAWAQSAITRSTHAPTASELRRAELRSVLKSPRMPGNQEQDQALAFQSEQAESGKSQQRHLSAQEKSDLRQQLRQQLRAGKPVQP